MVLLNGTLIDLLRSVPVLVHADASIVPLECSHNNMIIWNRLPRAHVPNLRRSWPLYIPLLLYECDMINFVAYYIVDKF